MNLLETVFEWVVSTTLRASLVAVAILAIQMLLRPWLPAKWRHPLWLPLLLVMVLPIVPALPLHLIPASPAAVAPSVPLSGGPLAMTTEAAEASTEAATTSIVVPAPPEKTPLLPALWLAGVLVTLTAGITGYRLKLKAIRAHAVSPSSGLQAEIEEARKAAGLSKTPLVWLSREVESPAVSGLWRPVLLLPPEFPATFTAAESRLILLHEFSHIKRYDLAQNWLLFALQALHWFNPVIWFAFSRVRLDRETACDARVLALDADDRRTEYGGVLLKMQEMPAVGGLRLGFLGIFENVSGLRSRITDISRHRRSHPAWQVAGCLLVAVIALFGSTRAEEARIEKKDAPQTGADTTPGKELSAGQAYIAAKLDKIIVPQVKFADTPIEEAIDFIRWKSTRLDTAELDPARKGLNFVMRKPHAAEGQKSARVTIDLENVPLRRVLDEIAKQSGMRYKIENYAVALVPADEKDPPQLTRAEAEAAGKAAPPEGPKAFENMNMLRITVLPVVDFENVTLTEAVRRLNALTKAISGGATESKIRIGPNTRGDTRIEELRLRNVPLFEAVKYCAEAVGEKFTVTDDGVQIGK